MKKIRKEKGLTQEELATMSGVTQEYISEIENGEVEGLTLHRLDRIAKTLKICTAELLIILLHEKCKENCVYLKKRE